MMLSRSIFVNGTSSAGKTSIARAFQAQASEPYMHLAVDMFFQAVPIRFWESTTVGDINPTKARIVSGFHRTIAALASAGNNIIVDHVLQEPEWWSECAALLTPLDAILVQVFCPLVELEKRERERGDRWPGLAQFQFERVYGPQAYDLLLDTSVLSVEACVSQIEIYIQSNPAPSAFQQVFAAR